MRNREGRKEGKINEEGRKEGERSKRGKEDEKKREREKGEVRESRGEEKEDERIRERYKQITGTDLLQDTSSIPNYSCTLLTTNIHVQNSIQIKRRHHIYAHFVGVGRRVARMMEGGAKLHVVGWGVAATRIPVHRGNPSVGGHTWSQR